MPTAPSHYLNHCWLINEVQWQQTWGQGIPQPLITKTSLIIAYLTLDLIPVSVVGHVFGLMIDCSNSIINILEVLQFCTKPPTLNPSHTQSTRPYTLMGSELAPQCASMSRCPSATQHQAINNTVWAASLDRDFKVLFAINDFEKYPVSLTAIIKNNGRWNVKRYPSS